MKFLALLVFALPYGVLSESCSYWDDGETWRGECMSPTACNKGGDFYVNDRCSGGANNKCCINAVCGNGWGWCINSNTDAGKKKCADWDAHFVSGQCPGPDNVKCCTL